ncbi:MAG: hypothetical protein ACR2NZ_06010 [Rubripirellula sp.]
MWIAIMVVCAGTHFAQAQNAGGSQLQRLNRSIQANPAAELGDSEDSLGDIIRDRSEDVGGLDSGLGEWLEQGIQNEVLSAAASRDRLTTEHVRELRKPMREIRGQATEDEKSVPENRAASYSVEEPLLEITATGLTPPLPDRYTICFTHRPLYYEQPLLERCGRGFRCAQNAISGAQFCVNTVFLPYHMCDQRADCPVPSGGDCLSCQPYPLDCCSLPLNCRAMSTQAAAFAGFAFLLL